MPRITIELPPHHARWYTDEQIQAAALLRDVPLLGEVPVHHLRELARTARYAIFPAGEAIVREGEFGATLYVIRSGQVDVVRGADGVEPVVLATLGPGEFFGELSVFDTGPRSATVVAREETDTIVIGHAALLRLVQRHPELGVALLRTLCRRLRTANDLLEQATRGGRAAPVEVARQG
jgi:CRP/FNR family transcriptional regulator, cyclic AMP receptor protein